MGKTQKVVPATSAETSMETSVETFMETSDEPAAMKYEPMRLKVNLYITGDLAFYAIILGKDGMSPKWCHLCQVKEKERAEGVLGELWTIKSYVDAYETKVATGQYSHPSTKSYMGVKTRVWWDFIPISHYVVPLLHCLIGVGNDILNKFRRIVADEIECLPEEEVEAIKAFRDAGDKVKRIKEELTMFKNAQDKGKEMKSLEGKIGRRQSRRSKLMAFALTGLAPSDSAVDLIEVSSDDESDTEDNGDELNTVDMTTLNPQMQSQIVEVNVEIARMENELGELKKEKKKIEVRLDDAKVSGCSFS